MTISVRRCGPPVEWKAMASGKPVRYVTERAVFGLGAQGVELLELAPGCDLERDLLAEMEFRPAIAPDLRPMDPAIFEPRLLGLREQWVLGGATAGPWRRAR